MEEDVKPASRHHWARIRPELMHVGLGGGHTTYCTQGRFPSHHSIHKRINNKRHYSSFHIRNLRKVVSGWVLKRVCTTWTLLWVIGQTSFRTVALINNLADRLAFGKFLKTETDPPSSARSESYPIKSNSLKDKEKKC